jgi:hypothetical protein
MAHHHRQARVHTPPAQHDVDRPSPTAPATRIDCDTCPVAGRGCAGCMVALLGPVRLVLDRAERGAVDALLAAGLLSAQEAADAFAEPELPAWMAATRAEHETHGPLRAIG